MTDLVTANLTDVLINTEFYKGLPFSWVTLAIRYGLKNDEAPIYQRINKKYGDLPLAIEIDVRETRRVSRDEMKFIIGRAALISLIHVGKKYDRPISIFEDMLENLPDSISG